ncbi:MAG: anti-sigma factor [Blastococcus sp.]
MQHCTPEQLALAALREPLPDTDTAHLATCDQCRAEVASLRRAVDALAVPQLAAPAASVPPPARVWESIAAATGVAVTPAGDDVPAEAEVLPFRRRPLLVVAAAVLAGAVVGAGAVAVVQTMDDGEQVTAVALDPLPGHDASGRAEVVLREDGTRVLHVDLTAPEPDDSYYEIWLIDTDVVGMFPLGVVQPGTQTVELPAGLDLGQYPIVDVSVEPLDGNPTHSGVSIARGQLET